MEPQNLKTTLFLSKPDAKAPVTASAPGTKDPCLQVDGWCWGLLWDQGEENIELGEDKGPLAAVGGKKWKNSLSSACLYLNPSHSS